MKKLIFILVTLCIVFACSKESKTGTVSGAAPVYFYTPLQQNDMKYLLYVDSKYYDTISYKNYPGDSVVINKELIQIVPSRGKCDSSKTTFQLSKGVHYLEFKSVNGGTSWKDSIKIVFPYCSGFPVLNKE